MLKHPTLSWNLAQNIFILSKTPKIELRDVIPKVNSSFPLQRKRWIYLTADNPRCLDHRGSLIKSKGTRLNSIFMQKSKSTSNQSPVNKREAQNDNKDPSSKDPANKRPNKIVPSSGQPSFTDAYNQKSCEKLKQLEKPQHLLVILDLNGTLLYRTNNGRRPTKVIPRPYSDKFLEDCTEKFTVAIWSSARPVNVDSMCDLILSPSVQEKIVAIWARDKFDLSKKDYDLRVICYKRLTKLWNDKIISRSHPEYSLGARWDQTNTVLIDDSIEKARTEPFNLIRIPEFMGDANEDGNILYQVYGFLNNISMFSNASAYIRQHPFILQKNS